MKPAMLKYCPQCAGELASAVRGGRERQLCTDPACGYVFWNNPTPVVAAIVERDGHIILVQSHGWPSHWFGLVTGFLESEETPAEAVVREVEEEIGLSATLGEFIGHYPFYQMNQILLAYHVEAGAGPVRLDTEELCDYREIPLEKAQPWPAGTGVALRDWLSARGIERDYVAL